MIQMKFAMSFDECDGLDYVSQLVLARLISSWPFCSVSLT